MMTAFSCGLTDDKQEEFCTKCTIVYHQQEESFSTSTCGDIDDVTVAVERMGGEGEWQVVICMDLGVGGYIDVDDSGDYSLSHMFADSELGIFQAFESDGENGLSCFTMIPMGQDNVVEPLMELGFSFDIEVCRPILEDVGVGIRSNGSSGGDDDVSTPYDDCIDYYETFSDDGDAENHDKCKHLQS